ncbi:MAG: hypothetical protein KF708_00220 [Pirellulales bacterium]|nr:hypothetical protein [Pirellulales bacterium]
MTPRNWTIALAGTMSLAVACGLAWWLGSSPTERALPAPGLAALGTNVRMSDTTLTREQLATLLGEAEAAYSRGQDLAGSDPAVAQSEFATAAAKYRLLTEHGAHNSRLYFNLGNAELQSGRVPAAIASYLQAESLAPGDRQVAVNLEHARTLAGAMPPRPQQPLWIEILRFAGAYRRLLVAITACAWFVLWSSLIAARFFNQFRWRYVVAPAALLVAGCGTGIVLEAASHDHAPHGVVTGNEAIIREAGGIAFAPRFEKPLIAGTEFSVVDRRADWLEIQLNDGRSGWIPSTEAQVIDRGTL